MRKGSGFTNFVGALTRMLIAEGPWWKDGMGVEGWKGSGEKEEEEQEEEGGGGGVLLVASGVVLLRKESEERKRKKR
jgi:hypothetical protein